MMAQTARPEEILVVNICFEGRTTYMPPHLLLHVLDILELHQSVCASGRIRIHT